MNFAKPKYNVLIVVKGLKDEEGLLDEGGEGLKDEEGFGGDRGTISLRRDYVMRERKN